MPYYFQCGFSLMKIRDARGFKLNYLLHPRS